MCRKVITRSMSSCAFRLGFLVGLQLSQTLAQLNCVIYSMCRGEPRRIPLSLSKTLSRCLPQNEREGGRVQRIFQHCHYCDSEHKQVWVEIVERGMRHGLLGGTEGREEIKGTQSMCSLTLPSSMLCHTHTHTH